MKNIILIVFLFVISSISISKAGEVTGAGAVKEIFKSHQLNLNKILKNNHQLLLGEVTGAGGPVEVNQVRYVVANKDLFNMNNLEAIEFKDQSSQKLKNILYLEIENVLIKAEDIQAVIIQN